MIFMKISKNFIKSHLNLVNLTDYSPQVMASMEWGWGGGGGEGGVTSKF